MVKNLQKLANRNIHAKIHLSNGSNKFICNICERTFATFYRLKIHKVRVHESSKGVKQFECQLCSKNFYLLADLKKHESSHSSQEQFECDICEKKCGTKYLMGRLM